MIRFRCECDADFHVPESQGGVRSGVRVAMTLCPFRFQDPISRIGPTSSAPSATALPSAASPADGK